MKNQIKASPAQSFLPFDSLSIGKERGKLYQTTCIICGKIFRIKKQRIKTAKYCSRKCRDLGKRKNRIRKNCLQCGKEFELRPSEIDKNIVLCSWECRKKYRIGKNAIRPWSQIKRKCEICGKEFYVSKYKAKKGIGRFCSQKCMFKWRSQIQRGKTHPRYNPKNYIQFECKYCGKIFINYKGRKWRKKFCSKKCKDENLKKKRITINCKNCGIKIEILPNTLKKEGRKYCSRKCQVEDCTIQKICLYCKKDFIAKISDKKYNRGKFCCRKCARLYNWNQPNIAQRILKAQREGMFIRPTRPEIIIKNITNKIIYVGNGKLWVSFKNGRRKNPDFKIIEQRKVIEVYGDYWHRNDNPEELIYQYAQIGYKCLIIWESEINTDPEEVKKKVNNFISFWEEPKELFLDF